MTDQSFYASDVGFTPTVKAIQTRRGSRAGYARMEQSGGWQTRVTPELAAFLAEQTSVFLGTATADGQPYIQHRGGPAGFLKPVDDVTLGFADFSGNRQYITQGNLTDNPKAFLFLIDYARRRRIKIWGEARVVEGDDALMAALASPDYKARVERAVLFAITAWDANCPQHIPQRFEAKDVAAELSKKDGEIAALQAKIAELTRMNEGSHA